jgi:hypothetical protein
MLLDIFKLNKAKIPLLSVTLNGKEVCSIRRIPNEKRFVLRLESEHPLLVFKDSSGTTYNHDLTSVVEEGYTWIRLFVQVSDKYSCQADCLINSSDKLDDSSFMKGELKGIRFQPFYLPGCKSKPEELIGQSLFFRGLHFPGIITQGNVSISCICDFCRKSFRLQSFHAGFGNDAYFYCSKGPHTLVIDSHIEGAPAPLCHPDKDALNNLESRLPKCQQCGGEFKYLNPLLCPSCGKPFVDFIKHPQIRDNEYYGNHIYGQKCQIWKEDKQ